MKTQNLVDNFIEVILDEETLMMMIDSSSHLSGSLSFPDHQLLIFDDLLCEIVSRKDDLMQKPPGKRKRKRAKTKVLTKCFMVVNFDIIK